MDVTDRSTAVSKTELLARLQATMPGRVRRDDERLQPTDKTGDRSSEPLPSSRVQRTTFTTSSRPRPAAAPRPEPEPKRWLVSALESIVALRWVIAALGLSGAVFGVIYVTRISVPLYRIQASIELQTKTAGYHVEALARVVQSQSLIAAAYDSLPEAERESIIEPSRFSFSRGMGLLERLRERVEAVAIPSAQVIDIDLLSPNREAAKDFLNALIQGLILRSQPSESISIIDPAIASSDPVSPNAFADFLVSVFCGLGIGVAFALIRDFAANTFGGPGSVSKVLGVRELGAMADRKLLSAPGEEVTATLLDANDESLRYLRSSLLYQPGKREYRCLAFTSAAPGEGKTTVVSSLSMSLAATGRRVLVIDGDLRRPRLYKLLQVPHGPGLSDLLRRDPSGPPAALSRYVAPTSFQNLYVLPPGTAGNDVPELLAGQNLAQLIRELGKSFDFVLIDTPPLLACADARNYARAAEGVVLVVRSSETQKRAAILARDMIIQDGSNIIGTVLTGWHQAYPAYSYPTTTNYVKS